MDDDEEKTKCPQRQLRFVDCHGFSFFHLGTERGRRERSGLVHRSHPRRKQEYDCLYASHQSGCQKAVARIDNYEYLLPKNKEFFRKLGVDSLIYPEMLAAKEIVSSMRMSWVRQWWGILRRRLDTDRYQDARKSGNTEYSPPSTGCTGHPLPRGSHQTRNGNDYPSRRRCY